MSKKQVEPVYSFNWLSSHLTTNEETRAFASDSLLLNASHLVVTAMEGADISRAQLAERIGKSRSYVSQVLSGSRNMTLKTLADLLWACGQEVAVMELQRLGEMRVPYESLNAWLDTETAHRTADAEQAVVSDASQFTVRIQSEVQNNERVAA